MMRNVASAEAVGVEVVVEDMLEEEEEEVTVVVVVVGTMIVVMVVVVGTMTVAIAMEEVVVGIVMAGVIVTRTGMAEAAVATVVVTEVLPLTVEKGVVDTIDMSVGTKLKRKKEKKRTCVFFRIFNFPLCWLLVTSLLLLLLSIL
jgi:hypothetical protein